MRVRQKQERLHQMVRDEFEVFGVRANRVLFSAKTGHGVQQLLPLIKTCYENASKRVTTVN